MPIPALTVSAIICTRNRADYLRDALRSLLTQDYSADAYEIVVVDNGSTDHTRSVVEEISAPPLNLNYAFVGQPGLSRARNAGAAASKNDILAYIDDDALADPGWLSAIARAFELLGRPTAGVGGKATVVWEGNPPGWFSAFFLPFFSGTNHLGDEPRLLGSNECPVGTNFAVRREALRAINGFDEMLTRYNDEIDVCRRLRDKGWQIWYAPDARVRHRIAGKRVTVRSLLRRGYWQGYSDVMIERSQAPRSHWSLIWSCMVLLFQLSRDGLRALLTLSQYRQGITMRHLFYAAGRLGRIRAQLALIAS